MKKKRSIAIVIILLICISIIAMIVVFNLKSKENSNIIYAETTKEERIFWNEFLNSNPYISQIQKDKYIDKTEMVKSALMSENVETEYIIEEEIKENNTLSWGDGYKKSRSNINEYVKNNFITDDIAYNFIDTYVKQGNYLIVGKEYVYFTKIKIPEKIYIAMKYQEENSYFEANIYEYDVTDENKDELNSYLETGEISSKIAPSNTYVITGKTEEDNVKIFSKSSI